MKMILTAALIAGVSTTAFAGDYVSKAQPHLNKEAVTSTSVQTNKSVEAKFPDSVRSQVLLGGLNPKHQEYLLRLRQSRDLYN